MSKSNHPQSMNKEKHVVDVLGNTFSQFT